MSTILSALSKYNKTMIFIHILILSIVSKELFMAGAGFILVKMIDNEPKLLGLVGLEKWQKKSSGKYDIPKGTIDRNEGVWEAAVRECFEETGIKVNKEEVISGPMTSGFLTVWLAHTNQQPIISANPVTGKKEHLGYDWLPAKDLWMNCFDFLCEFVEWGEKELIKKGYQNG